jgi:hypothetical protein
VRLPQAERAFLDVGKIEDYCLNPTHLHGRHKARVFRDALGLNRADAVWLKAVLLSDLPSEGLARGQVGTVVEALDSAAVLVEFSDPHGRAYAIVPCLRSELLVLHQAPQTA